jgi:hypothetical protein
MVDNFEQIKSILKFEDDYFYFIQIIQRKKEIPELGSNNRTVRSYTFSSLKHLEKIEQEIIKMCEVFNARAYIHLNRRKWSRISLECLRHNAELIANGQHDDIRSSLETVIGRNNCEPKGEKTWIVDIDDKLPAYIMQVEQFINSLEPMVFTNLDTGETVNKIKAIIPTKNGYHLITSPFNSQLFKQKYLEIDIHKDNPTILYIP